MDCLIQKKSRKNDWKSGNTPEHELSISLLRTRVLKR